MAKIKKACKGALYPKSSSVSRRLKSGGSFPDLNKDGKITKKDILIGKGVLPKTAKKGKMVKKAQTGWSTIKDKLKKATSSETIKKTYKPLVDKVKSVTLMPKPKQKMGGKTKKCAYGCK